MITQTMLTPHLVLNGKSKEAMKFYRQAIGAPWDGKMGVLNYKYGFFWMFASFHG